MTETEPPARTLTNRRVLVGVVVIGGAILAAAAFLIRTGAPVHPAGPDGTLGLRRVLVSQGIVVRDGARPPVPPATFVLLADLRTDRQERDLLMWAGRGGRLVVADPGSVLTQELGVSSSTVGTLFGDRSLEPGCVAPEMIGVRHIETDARDAILGGGPSEAVSCFPEPSGSYEMSLPRGRGSVVLLGGHSFLVNRRLGRADDALYAVQLLRSQGPVVFGPPIPPGSVGGPSTVWGALPDGAKAATLALAVALVAFAVSRGRRLGKPVTEEPISPIPASELVLATADLYRQARAVAFAAEQLRHGFAARVGPKMGAPPGSSPHSLVEPLQLVAGRPREFLERLLVQDPPSTDEGLIALARDLEAMARRVAGDETTAHGMPERIGAGAREGQM